MLNTDIQAYSATFRYFEQSGNWSASSRSGRGGGPELVSLSTRMVEFRLEVLHLSETQTETQAAVAERLAGLLARHGIDPGRFNHQGRSILTLSPHEAQTLVAEDGYWGINSTSQRLADFVLKGAGDNLSMLRAGREGILRGFKEAEKIWGGALPEISHQTLAKALAAIDERIQQLGGAIIDHQA